MNPSYTNGVGAGAFGTSAPVISSGEDVVFFSAPEKKSRKGLWILAALIVVLLLVGGGFLIWRQNLESESGGEETAETEDTRSAEEKEMHEFIEINDEEVLHFLTLIGAIYKGEIPAEDLKGEMATEMKGQTENGLAQLEAVAEDLKEKATTDDFSEIQAELEAALERDLPKYRSSVEFLGEILDGFANGVDVAGIEGGDGARVAAAFREKVPDFRISGEGSVANCWVRLWDATRLKEVNNEE